MGSSEIKERFLKDFQNRIVLGRQLLQNGNHKWGDKVYNDLHLEIEKQEWLAPQKKRQLILIISNSWWIYLNSLINRKQEDTNVDLIRYIDAYNRFFSFLSKLEEFNLFSTFWTTLLKRFIHTENVSITGITKFINSFCEKVKERENNIKLVQLQLLLIFLRKSIITSDLFRISLKILGDIFYKLEPSKKSLFLYVLLDNLNIEYQLSDKSDSFIIEINKILANRLPSYVKEEFDNLKKINVNDKNFGEIQTDLDNLIYYLNNIGEYSWIIVIIKNIFAKVREYQSLESALDYVKRFINYLVNRNQFELVYEIYDFLEDVFMYHTDLKYDKFLIELWVEACKNFVDVEEKKYLFQAMEKLSNHLKNPQDPKEIFHFFYTYNYLWQFKSKFLSLDMSDFWKMMFFRALYEEKDLALAEQMKSYLPEELKQILTDFNSLYNVSETIRSQIYDFNEDNEKLIEIDYDLIARLIIFRIDPEGAISFTIVLNDNKIMEGKITNEYWNDSHIMEIYDDLFSDKKAKTYTFNLIEFGKLIFLFLPKNLRQILKRLKNNDLDQALQIYFILDSMIIPFDFIYDNKFFMLKYECGYKIGEPSISGIFHELSLLEQTPSLQSNQYNILIIESINSTGPFKWDEQQKKNILLFPFLEGNEELDYITNFFNNRTEVNEITILNGINSTRENILKRISQGNSHIIHLVGNIFYSKLNPKYSYIITNDNSLITFNEIKKSLDQNQSSIEPIIVFNVQVFDTKGLILKNVLKIFGEIVNQFNYDAIAGITCKIYPIFNKDTRELISNFYNQLFKKKTQGDALLGARQSCKSGLALSSFILFGKPWKRL